MQGAPKGDNLTNKRSVHEVSFENSQVRHTGGVQSETDNKHIVARAGCRVQSEAVAYSTKDLRFWRVSPMRVSSKMLVTVVLPAVAAAASTPAWIPTWSAPIPDGSKPLGGLKQVSGYSATRLYKATPEIGTYNHAAMIQYFEDVLIASWKNSPQDEDAPGQRILWSFSRDGTTWTQQSPGSVASLFPNMSTTANPAHLFAEPFLVLNGHLYAAASPTQFCLFPDQYQPVLLLRRVQVDPTNITLGTIFWVASRIPPGFEEASKAHGVRALPEMDPESRTDAALLTPNSTLPPCLGNYSHAHTNKCEACEGACQSWEAAQKEDLANERTRYVAQGSGADSPMTEVLLYRSRKQELFASTRKGGASGTWSEIVETGIPDVDSNINAGTLPDGSVFLVSNAIHNAKIRDPLTVAVSKDGRDFSAVAAAISCTELPPGGSTTDPCLPAYPGRAKGPGPAYPQVVVVQGSGRIPEGMYIVISNNKEDIFVVTLPLANLPQP